MVGTLLRRLLSLGSVILIALGLPAALPACPFCKPQLTLTNQINQASLVLYGTLANATPGADFREGTTDLQIDAVVKNHDTLKGKKVVTLSRYMPFASNKKYKFLIFCDLLKEKIDPYSCLPVPADSDMPKYLKGALELKDVKDVGARLKFFFDYLDNADLEISNDAYHEFGNTDYRDYRDLAQKLPADKISKWLRDSKTPGSRFGLYASMLGHCGTEEDAKLLRSLLDDPQRRGSSGMDGILAGYTMLKPKEGWTHVRGLLKDTKRDFLIRHTALRAARFLWEFRPDLVEKTELVAGVCELLDDPNLADLAIDDLRKWGRPEIASRVLGLCSKPGYDIPIVRRSILRYALTFPQSTSAAEFVADRRKKDPQMVADVEELLKLEQTLSPSNKDASAEKK